MFKADLEAAGIAYVDAAGHVADFHSLRHSFISMLAAGGVHPKLAQTLARHSDINLTMSRYSHTVLSDEADALSVLPSLPSPFDEPEPDRQVMQPTGTEGGGNCVPDSVPSGVPERGAFQGVSVHLHSLNADENSAGPDSIEAAKQVVLSNKGGERGIRTLGTGCPAHRISNPAHSATLASLRLFCSNVSIKL